MPDKFYIVSVNGSPKHLCLDEEIANEYAKKEREQDKFAWISVDELEISY